MKRISVLNSHTDRAGTTGIHWQGVFDIHQKTEIFFYDFKIRGLKNFIIQDDQKIVENLLSRFEETTRTDNKLTLVKTSF